MSTPETAKPGHLPSLDSLVDIPRLITAYYALHPDPAILSQRVAFGTSGHRGTAFAASFNDDHIAATNRSAIVRIPREGAHTGTTVSRARYARSLRAGLHDCARGAGGQWRRSDD